MRARSKRDGEWLEENVLEPVPHRQYVFTLPRLLRPSRPDPVRADHRGSRELQPARCMCLPRTGRFLRTERCAAGCSSLVEGFRRAALKFLAQNDAISEDLRFKLLGWRYSGFSAHNQVRVGGDDVEGRKKLAGYMLRAPISLEKMSYDAETGTVIYRSRMHAGLKRNFPGDARRRV